MTTSAPRPDVRSRTHETRSAETVATVMSSVSSTPRRRAASSRAAGAPTTKTRSAPASCAKIPAFNPTGYHLGSVWAVENATIALGLRRYGFKDEAATIAAGILEAAEFFDGRLPEAFGGYERSQTKYPVQYPTACSPQAWSTGAPLLLLRTMLGLEPQGEHLVVDPALPQEIGHLELLDIPGRWGRIDAFGRGRVDVRRR